MIARSSLCVPAVAALLAGCATTIPPEREERDRIILAAVEPCRDKYSDVFGRQPLSVNPDGRVRYWYKGHLTALSYEIERCMSEARKGVRFGPWLPGKLVKAGPTTVSMTTAGRDVVVPVRVNGMLGAMVVRSGADFTFVSSAYAKRAALHIVSESPLTSVRAGDKSVAAPYVRARAIEVGDAVVEAVDVVVHDAFSVQPPVDGILGKSFLAHFKVNLDRSAARVTLEPFK